MKKKLDKMKKIIANHIIGVILGIVIGSTMGVTAANMFASSDVIYDNSESGASSTTVQGALDELYVKADKCIFDTTAPVITVDGHTSDYTVTIEQGDSFTIPTGTVTDDIDKNVTLTKTGTVTPGVAGKYYVTYSAEDSSGNKSTLTLTVLVTKLDGLEIYLMECDYVDNVCVELNPDNPIFGPVSSESDNLESVLGEAFNNNGFNYVFTYDVPSPLYYQQHISGISGCFLSHLEFNNTNYQQEIFRYDSNYYEGLVWGYSFGGLNNAPRSYDEYVHGTGQKFTFDNVTISQVIEGDPNYDGTNNPQITLIYAYVLIGQ